MQTMLGTPEDYWTGGNDLVKNAIEFRWDVGNVLFWKYDLKLKLSCICICCTFKIVIVVFGFVFAMAFACKAKPWL